MEVVDRKGPGSSEGLGLRVTGLTTEAARRFGHAPDEKGVLVVGVKPGSLADENGIRTGDLIKELDRKRIESVKELSAAISKDELKGTMFLIKRPRLGMIVIKME